MPVRSGQRNPTRSALDRLARAAGVVPDYVDGLGHHRRADDESVLAALRALGIDIASPAGADRAVAELLAARAVAPCEPVCVAWQGRRSGQWLKVSPGDAGRSIRCRIRWEDGGELSWDSGPRGRAVRPFADGRAVRVEVPLPADMPSGAHRLTLDVGRTHGESMVLSAPSRCAQGPGLASRDLGLFLPLYAARSDRNGGVGDFTDLADLQRWAAGMGCRFFGTLPILAGFLDKPFDPSPYAPISRLFWNELYLDLTASPDLALSAAARRLLASPEARRTQARWRRLARVDYRPVYALKRRALDALAAAAFANARRRADLDAFRRHRPLAHDYARFRAVVEAHGATWQEWPRDQRPDGLPASIDHTPAYRRHLYAQLLAQEQLDAAASGGAAGLYLDFPVGVHGGGFDTWRFRDMFVPNVAVGAPPDAVFAGGQNWGLRPLHPWNRRADGHAYFRACLRFMLASAGALRIDHVMGLHRLYGIPTAGGQGLYLQQPYEELYAALCIESQRAGALIVGENLGTVPPGVNEELDRRGILTMHVTQFMLSHNRRAPCPPARRDTLVSINTHDTPTFAAYWRGLDIARRLRDGSLDRAAAARERSLRDKTRRAVVTHLRQRGLLRSAGVRPVLEALLRLHAAEPARMLLVNLEDLWLETEPQNRPGLLDDRVNWNQKARRTVGELADDRRLTAFLQRLAAARRITEKDA